MSCPYCDHYESDDEGYCTECGEYTEIEEPNYSEASTKLDKFMPEDEELQNAYYEILDSDDEDDVKITELARFISENADEERMFSYLGSGNVETFARYLVKGELEV